MSRAVHVLLVVFLLVGRAAAAATTVVYDVSDGARRTYYHDGPRVRLQNPGGSYPESALVLDVEARHAYLVFDDVKQYVDMYANLREKRKAMAPLKAMARQSAARAAREQVRFVAMGEKRTIAEISCEMYRRLANGRVEEELCTAPWSPAVPGAADTDFMDTVMDQWFEAMFGPGSVRRAKDRDPLPGFPMLRLEIRQDGSRGDETRVVSVNLGPVPASLFVIPPDYRRVDRPPDGPGSSSMPRVEAEPAPRAAAAGTAARRHWPAAALLLIMVLAGIGVLIHAGLLHLAALMVLDRPRFPAALMAVFIVWVMTLPLELLETRVPLLAGVSGLASFGGLKIAYGASNGRTIMLFLVSMAVTLGLGLFFGMFAVVGHGLTGG